MDKEKQKKQKQTVKQRESSKRKKRTKIDSASAGKKKQQANKGITQTSKKKKPSQRKKRKQKKQSRIVAMVVNVCFYLFILFIMGSSILFATSKSTDKSILGYRVFGVLTDSMVPRDPKTQKGGFHSGDIIIVKNIPGEKAEVGDIITFRPSVDSKAFLTHRVKKKLDHLGEIKGTYYITQGDANLAEDVPIHSKQVVGKKVFMIPKIGGAIAFVVENPVVTILFLISVVGFITVMRYYIFNK